MTYIWAHIVNSKQHSKIKIPLSSKHKLLEHMSILSLLVSDKHMELDVNNMESKFPFYFKSYWVVTLFVTFTIHIELMLQLIIAFITPLYQSWNLKGRMQSLNSKFKMWYNSYFFTLVLPQNSECIQRVATLSLHGKVL